MKEKTLLEVKELIRNLGARRYKKDEWNGYTVYEPVYSTKVCIGFPLIVLVKGEEVRISTNKESIEYLDQKYGNEEDEE